MIEFGVRRYCTIEERHELFWYPDTYGVARGSSGNESDTTRRQELLCVPVAFFLAFFSGTT